MKNGTYHRDLPGGVPADAIKSFLGTKIQLAYSRHAMQEAVRDRYTNPNAPWVAPRHVLLSARDIVEAQVEDGVAIKAVVRVPLDLHRDIVLVLNQPDSDLRAAVRTLWINEANDKHSTLDKSKYAN